MRDRFVDAALEEAQHSTMLYKHGCVIVRRGKIIGRACNRRTFRDGHKWSEHAEVAACKSLASREALRGAHMYVVKLHKQSGKAMLSHPCHGCSRFLRVMMERHGLRHVFYSL